MKKKEEEEEEEERRETNKHVEKFTSLSPVTLLERRRGRKKGFFSVNGSKSWMQMQRDPLLTIKR